MAAAAELILGAMLPVFVFQYAGLDPKLLTKVHLPAGINSLALLNDFPGPPIWHIYLLGSAPILVIGVANFFLVPLAVAAGRRPVLLTTGAVAIGGCVGSGFSTSFGMHLAFRTVQALGAGTVESLIPFILQDMVFQHQRNAAVSVVFATQGLIIAILGIASPYIIGHLTWRVLYFATACAGLVFWVAIFVFLPETKFSRPEDEQEDGGDQPAAPIESGLDRPAIDYVNYVPRRWSDDLRIITGKPEWKEGVNAMWDSIRTFFYPHLFFITMLNSAVIALAVAAGYTAAPQLLADPWSWPFYHLGFCLFPIILAACASFILSGYGADLVANWIAGKKGARTPEVQLLNLIFPCLTGLIGCLLFGFSGEHPERYHWMVFLLGLAFIAFAFLATNTIGIVYVLESNPQLAGPSLVNIASFRCLIAFALSFKVSEWVADFGYLKTFTIYASVLGAFTLFIPIIYIWGAAWRKRWQS